MNEKERKLLGYFRKLQDQDAVTLLAFAEFLGGRNQRVSSDAVAAKPLEIERPAQESVIAAIKRLSATYPMLDNDTLLHETSGIMTGHVLHGREAQEVIDELEQLFSNNYDAYLKDFNS